MPTQPLRHLCYFLIVSSLSGPSVSTATETVRAEIEKTIAWTGEAVPLIITLYSPGPFSSAAAFDLPDLPRTAFVKSGSPLVGSEVVDGESYFTQRHQLTIYTQNAGEIIIPPFRVRFAGKKTFTSDPEPMEGVTPELRFESKRPPGTEAMGIVVSTTEMNFQQTWSPEPVEKIKTGDVVIRTIKRTAVGTTAMMLPVIPADAPDGVQVYIGASEVEDKQDRGDVQAERRDIMKYQFQQAGTFDLPELVFAWWDPQQEKLQRQSLSGLTITVSGPNEAGLPASQSNPGTSSILMFAIIGLVLFAGLGWLARKPIRQLIKKWQAHHSAPDAIAIRKLRAACRSNDESSAYSVLMSWAAVTRSSVGRDCIESGFDTEKCCELREQWQALSRFLYATEPGATICQGDQLWTAFSRMRHQPKRKFGRQPQSALPQLDPSERTTSRL